MTVVIDGDVVEAPGTDMEALEQRLMGLSAVSVEQREAEITATLEQSAQLLALVSQATDPARFASAGKSAAAMASEYSKRLGVSKDIVLDAQVQQRRWERALGVAIREGQERGEITSRNANLSQYAEGRQESFGRAAPTDFASKSELGGGRAPGTGIYGMTDNVTESEFDAALVDSLADGNVSRVNVVRKIKEAKGTAPDPEPKRKGDPKRAKKQLDTLRRLVNSLEGTQIILDDFSHAGLDPAITDEEANEIIAGLDTFVRAIGRVKKSLNGN